MIAAVPVFAWAVTFFHEFGYCTYFGIPPYLIRPDLATIFSATWIVLGFGLFVILIASFSFFFTRRSTGRKSLLFYVFFITLLLTFGISLRVGSSSGWQQATVGVILFIIAYAAALLLAFASAPVEASPISVADQRAVNPDTPFTARVRGFMLPAIFVATLLALSGGIWEAWRQDQFLLPRGFKETVLLRVYGATAICAEYDRATMRLKPSLILLEIKNSTVFDVGKIGQLKHAK